MSKSYAEAAEEISRLLENLGGSANAYSSSPSPVKNTFTPAEEPPQLERFAPDNEFCGSFPLFPPGASAPQIPGFSCRGSVDDAGELQAVYDLIESLAFLGTPEGVPSVTLETGTYFPRLLSDGKSWEIEDTQKGILYRQQPGTDDLCITVQRTQDQKVLGHLMNGWVLLSDK